MILLACVAILVAGVVLVVAGWPSSPVRALPSSGAAPSRGGQPRGFGGSGWRRVLGRRARSSRQREPLAGVLVEVASRLRAGAPLALAWRRVLPTPHPAWADPVLEAVGLTAADLSAVAGSEPDDPAARPQRRVRGVRLAAGGRSALAQMPMRVGRRGQSGMRAQVAAAASACALARRTGAPLAEVIDVVVAGIEEAEEAADLRRTALAGPRATGRLLAWLPLGGLILGVVVGADPIGVLLGGGLGGLCLVAGAALFVVGHRWVGALVHDAERAGSSPVPTSRRRPTGPQTRVGRSRPGVRSRAGPGRGGRRLVVAPRDRMHP